MLTSSQDLCDILIRVFVKGLVMSTDDDRDIDRAEDRKFMGLLKKAPFALDKGPGAALVSNRADANTGYT